MTLPGTGSPRGAPGRTSPLSLLPLLVGGLAWGASSAVAQNSPLPPPSQAQQALQQALQQQPGLADIIRSRIQQSGLTAEQVRARLPASRHPLQLLWASFKR